MSLMPCSCDRRSMARPDQRYNQIVPIDFFKPWGNIFRQIDELTKGVSRVGITPMKSDGEKYHLSVDVHNYAPDELNIEVIDGFIVVKGKHEEKQDEHGRISRQFVRRIALPKGCLPGAVRSSLSSDGVLTVVAPKILRMPSTGERIVPIIQTGPVKKQII